jgi:hypothetical protein
MTLTSGSVRKYRPLLTEDTGKDTDADGRIILKGIFKKWNRAWTGLIGLRIGIGVGFL